MSYVSNGLDDVGLAVAVASDEQRDSRAELNAELRPRAKIPDVEFADEH